MKLKKGDAVIILILAAAVFSWLAAYEPGESKDAGQVVIEVNGNVYKTIPMSDGMKSENIHIELENGNHIDIAVSENGAYVKDVECPDKVCQKTGLVSRAGQSIVCLPNKVVVYIEGKKESEVDDISF